MALFRSTILLITLTSAVFAQNVGNPSSSSMYNPASSMMNTALMGQQQQQAMLGMNAYQSGYGNMMMPGAMMNTMNPQMNTLTGGYPSMLGQQQSRLGMNPYQQTMMPGSMMGMGMQNMYPQQSGLGGYGMPSPMMGMPGSVMTGYGNPMMTSQSPFGLPMMMGQQPYMFNPYQQQQSMMPRSPLMSGRIARK